MRSTLCFLLLLTALLRPCPAVAGHSVHPDRRAAPGQSGSAPPLPPSVASDPAGLCETAGAAAEFATRLPPRLLGAISLTETGRIDAGSGTLRPWPWTINAEGAGRYFATEQAAGAAVTALRARGVQSIDVGCMQVNLMYHPGAFASLRDAFDPRGNALYAARFLNSLHEDGRDWPRVIAAYHSETPARGDAYRVLVLGRWRNPIGQNAGWRNPGSRDVAPVPLAYRDFAPKAHAYGAFAPIGQVYGAFAEAPESRYQVGR